MASDLSKLIQDSITLTLNGLLAKDAKILQITQAHAKDLENVEVLKVQSSFDFSNFTSNFFFFVPGKSSSLIFNTMMGSPITDLSEDIDDDAEDAIGEFISNTSGSLTTAINGSGLDDIGQTKFNIAHKEIMKGRDVTNLENTYKFNIDLEGSELIIFITFEEVMIPYLADITASDITSYEEVKEIEEEPEEEIEEEPEEEIEIEKGSEETQKESTKNNKTDPIPVEKKELTPNEKKLKLIIIGIASFLGLIVFVFLLMYLIGVFDEEPVLIVKDDSNASQLIKDPNQVDIVKYGTLQKVIFNVSDIDNERLNNKLTELTKYRVLNKEELEAQKLDEKNRLFELEREKELLEFSKNNQEETLFEKQELKKTRVIDKKTKFKEETFTIAKDEVLVTNNTPIITDIPKKEIIPTLNYVVTNSLKYSLFKSLVQETNTKQARISICNNTSGKTTIYIGPFETVSLQNTMIELIQKNNSTIATSVENITEEEFNIRCNLE